MADKQLTFDEDARASLMRGVNELKRVVGLTLGPSGRNVLLSRMFGLPVVCSDGVTVAKEVELPDPYENLGAQLVKEAASKTNDAVGDGTTTSVVLAQSIVHNGFMNVAFGANGILANICGDISGSHVTDFNRDCLINVQDIVQLANCVLANACGD